MHCYLEARADPVLGGRSLALPSGKRLEPFAPRFEHQKVLEP